ncbi:MAG: hypothetical protein ACRDY7_08440, partial [Acidimicrobiia bacterium]
MRDRFGLASGDRAPSTGSVAAGVVGASGPRSRAPDDLARLPPPDSPRPSERALGGLRLRLSGFSRDTGFTRARMRAPPPPPRRPK